MTISMTPSATFWKGKRVLLTGHSGFKGAWLSLWLDALGADISGISLPPETSPNLFTLAEISACCLSHFCDIRDESRITELIYDAQPEIVFHLAAQPLVRRSYRQPLETISVNVVGTANILNALRDLPGVRVVMVVTTDKVYRNQEWPYPYREDDPLGGHDPYSASKAACEIITASYRDSFLSSKGVAVATARAGNVIGGGDWSEDRLIPDAVRAWQTGNTLKIRSPQSVRPWQHVLDPLYGYLSLAQLLWDHQEAAGAYNFGPHTDEATAVGELAEMARQSYGKGKIVHTASSETMHEARWLALEIAKSRETLKVVPRWSLGETVDRTMAWYKALQRGENARNLCLADMAAFTSTVSR